jgi:photosystem II stability/assembly factor-like uncharacterized protein
MKFRLILPGALALASGVVAGAGWTANNGGLPGATAGVIALTVDPSAPSALYAVTSSGGLFKSTDAAGSWNPVNGIGGVSSLVVDPQTSSTVYAVSRGRLVKSTDGGTSWNRASASSAVDNVFKLAIDPLTPSTFYALSYGHIFKSTNSGADWREVYTFVTPNSAGSLAIDPVTPSTLYASAANADILKSTDGGENWAVIKKGLPQTVFAVGAIPLAIDPVTPSTLYAGSFAAAQVPGPGFDAGAGSISRSTDGGITWSVIRSGIPSDAFVRSVALDPTTPAIVYAAYTNSSGSGILQSTNGGQSWNVVNAGLPSNFRGALVALSPTSSSAVYAAFGDFIAGTGGVFRSTDGATSWSAANAGLDYFDLHVLAIDPAHPASLYTGEAGGLFKSDDAGASWRILNTFQIAAPPFPPGFGAGVGVVRSVLIDLLNPNVLYVETTRAGGCVFTDKDVFKSTDGGASFSDGISPPQSGCILGGFSAVSTLMAMDPVDPNTLYLGETEDEDGAYALLKSTDGGQNWRSIWDYGTPTPLQSDLNALAIDPVHPTTLYAAVGDASFYITPGSTGTGVFKSTDGGATWDITGLKDTAVTVLAIDPSDPSILYAGTQGIYTEPRGFRGLFKSTDSGATWVAVNNGLTELSGIGGTITAVVVAPNRSNTVYIGTSGGGVYKSVDGGANWSPFNDGLISRDIRALAVSPGALNTLFAATASGVFSILDDTSNP